jgi:hypothetical protein
MAFLKEQEEIVKKTLNNILNFVINIAFIILMSDAESSQVVFVL